MHEVKQPIHSTGLYLGEIRTAIDSSFVRGIIGTIQDEEEELLLNELPAFAVGPVQRDGTVDLYLCLYSSQKAIIETYWSDEEWDINEIEALTTEAFFIGLRIATIKNHGSFGITFDPPKLKHRINYSLYEADPLIIDDFLKQNPSYSWLYRLNEHDETLLHKVGQGLARYLSKFQNFDFGSFLTVLIDGLLLLRLGEGHFAYILEEIYSAANEETPLGHVINTDGRKVEIISTNTVDLDETPVLVAEDKMSQRKVLIQATKGRSLKTNGYKIAAATFKGEKTSTSSGLRIGSPVRVPTENDLRDAIKPEIIGTAVAIPIAPLKGVNIERKDFYFEIIVEPGVTSLNAAIIGPTRSGKTNVVKTFLVQLARHNIMIEKQGLSFNKFGAIFLDKQGEFSSQINVIHDVSPLLQSEFMLLDPTVGMYARIRLQDVHLSVLLEKEDWGKYGKILSKLIQWLCKEKGFKPATKRNGKERNAREKYEYLTPKIVEFLLDLSGKNIKEFQNWSEKAYQIQQVQAALRRLQIFTDDRFINLFQISYVDGKYEEIHEQNTLEDFLINAQRNGFILILDLSNLDPVGIQSREAKFLTNYCLNVLHKARKRLFTRLGEKEFRRNVPIFYIIDEEATSELTAPNVDYNMWIESVTGASKLLLGNIFVFQSTLGIKPLLLSQLSGFSIIFPIPQQKDRENVMAGAAINDIGLYEEYLSESKVGTALAASEAYGRRGFIIKTKRFEYFLEEAALGYFPTPRVIIGYENNVQSNLLEGEK